MRKKDHSAQMRRIAKYWIKRPPIPVRTIPVIPIRAIPLELK